MELQKLFTEELWSKWEKNIEDNFEKRKYYHFDHPFDFPNAKQKIKDVVSDPRRVVSHPFIPLVKILMKTPRYRYQEELAGGTFLSANDKKQFYELETKIRPISFASHFDRYIYSFYSYCLTERYQIYIRKKGFSDCIYAYRNDLDEKCNVQFAKEVFSYIEKIGPCTAIALDIKGYFDSIDHQILKEKWCKILGENVKELPLDQYKIFQSLTQYSYINNNTILKHFKVDLQTYRNSKKPTLSDIIPGATFREKFESIRKNNLIVVNREYETAPDGTKRYYGIPQGSPISALLSNIYLLDFDKKIYERSIAENFLYRRYCDDLILVVPTNKVDEYYKLILDEIKCYHLIIQKKKTELIQFTKDKTGKLRGFDLDKMQNIDSFDDIVKEEQFYKNLQYLGFEFNGHKTYLRATSLSRYFRKMRSRIIKTVSMAYSPKAKSNKIFKKQLFQRYTHLGQRNFLTYALNASKKEYYTKSGDVKEGMDSVEIRKQVSKHFDVLLYELQIKTNQRIKYKLKRKKLKKVRR